MPARRRRGPSESGDDLVITTNSFLNNHYQQQQRPFQSTNQHYNVEKATFEKIEEDLLKQRLPIIITMTARDRTNEFANAIRSIQSRTVARAAVSRTPRHAKQIQSYSEFMMTAKNIGKNIASTYSKLEKLAMCRFIFLTYCYYYNAILMRFCNCFPSSSIFLILILIITNLFSLISINSNIFKDLIKLK